MCILKNFTKNKRDIAEMNAASDLCHVAKKDIE